MLDKMESNSIHAIDHVAQGEGKGKGPDPLEPIEHLILDLLLKKQAGVNVEAEVRSICSTMKVEDVVKASPGPSKLRAKPEPRKQVTEESETDCDMSDGPLDDEHLEKLMRDYNFGLDGSGESEGESLSENDEEVFHKPLSKARGRRGRGGQGVTSKSSRGDRGTSQKAQAGMFGQQSYSDFDDEEIDESNPLMLGASFMDRTDDDQMTRYLDEYNLHLKKTPNAKFVNEKFLTWLGNKAKSSSLAPPKAPITQGKKIAFQLPVRGGVDGGSGRRARGSGSGRK